MQPEPNVAGWLVLAIVATAWMAWAVYTSKARPKAGPRCVECGRHFGAGRQEDECPRCGARTYFVGLEQ